MKINEIKLAGIIRFDIFYYLKILSEGVTFQLAVRWHYI